MVTVTDEYLQNREWWLCCYGTWLEMAYVVNHLVVSAHVVDASVSYARDVLFQYLAQTCAASSSTYRRFKTPVSG